MNKKAITGLTVIFMLVAFWVGWIFFVGPMVNVQVDIAISNGNLTGIEAFILGNLNLIIGFASLLFLFWSVRSGF